MRDSLEHHEVRRGSVNPDFVGEAMADLYSGDIHSIEDEQRSSMRIKLGESLTEREERKGE